jgi:hypothetical protein
MGDYDYWMSPASEEDAQARRDLKELLEDARVDADRGDE